MPADDDDLLWTAVAGGAALVAATGAKKALAKSWTKRRGSVPGNPATGATSWGEALVWAVASGVVVGMARLVAQRGAAAAFARLGRQLPGAAATKPTA